MIIGVLNQKGGVGKTTISINLAACFAKAGLKTLLVDADPQGSSLAWSSAREAEPIFPVIGMAKPSLHKDLPAVAADYDITVIDGAPRVSELSRAAILASDLVVIPVQPSPFDVWATDDTVQLVTEAQQFREGLQAVFTINRKIVNTAIGRDITNAFVDYPFPVLKTALCQRVIFAESAARGLAVIEVDSNCDAAKEVASLIQEILQQQEAKAA